MNKQRRPVLVRAFVYFAATNLVWESLQTPLYTIWAQGWGTISFAVIHCTAGDVVIGGATILVALVIFGREWPQCAKSRARVAIMSTALGLAYTIFSEWLNVEVRGSWAYADAMPVVPIVGTGLSPLAQWLLIPPLTLWLAATAMPSALPKVEWRTEK